MATVEYRQEIAEVRVVQEEGFDIHVTREEMMALRTLVHHGVTMSTIEGLGLKDLSIAIGKPVTFGVDSKRFTFKSLAIGS